MNTLKEMFKIADKYNLQKAMTIIIGLGETIYDFKILDSLADFPDGLSNFMSSFLAQLKAPSEINTTSFYFELTIETTEKIANAILDFYKE